MGLTQSCMCLTQPKKEMSRLVREAVEQLPEAEQEAVLLLAFEGLTSREAAPRFCTSNSRIAEPGSFISASSVSRRP